jgi:hypothetical protein
VAEVLRCQRQAALSRFSAYFVTHHYDACPQFLGDLGNHGFSGARHSRNANDNFVVYQVWVQR